MTAEIVALSAPAAGVKAPNWTKRYKDAADRALAVEVWDVVVAEMRGAGTLSAANVPAITRYVDAVVTYEQAQYHLDMAGPVLGGDDAGKGQYWNMWMSVREKASTEMERGEDRLGLSPRRRGQVTAAKRRAAKVTAADAFIARAKG